MAKTRLTLRDQIAAHALLSMGDVHITDIYRTVVYPDTIVEGGKLYKQANRWKNSAPVREYLASLKRDKYDRATRAEESEGTDREIRTKDDIARELNRLADVEADPKRRAEILMKVADLLSLKREETKEEDNKRVKMYLPYSCSFCPIWNDYKELYAERTGQEPNKDKLSDIAHLLFMNARQNGYLTKHGYPPLQDNKGNVWEPSINVLKRE